MGISDEELDALGVKKIDEFVPIPDEWTNRGRREIKGKEGKKYVLIVFGRPNEEDIELFAHSIEARNGKLFAEKTHIERQAEQARKFGKNPK